MLKQDEIIDKDEVLKMARQARLHRNQHNLASKPVQYRFSYDGTEEALIDFAKLVADKATAKAVEREREACAKICDKLAEPEVQPMYYRIAAQKIRARGG